MGCVSAGDLRGQLLDTIRGKAAAAGVLETVFSQLQIVVPVLYKHVSLKFILLSFFRAVIYNWKCFSKIRLLYRDQAT